MAKKKNHYVDNERFLEDIKEYKNHVSNDYYKQNPEFTSDKYIVDNKNYYEILYYFYVY